MKMAQPTTPEVRAKVLSAFDPDTYYYSHELPFSYDGGFIDGMAWVGLLCGAAYKVGDLELAQAAERYLGRLLAVGPDARNFAPQKLDTDWVASATVPGYWYSVKPQSFAGPAALRFAIDNGAHLNDPFQAKSKARTFVAVGPVFGWAVSKWFGSWLQQHVNTMFLAYLILNKKPASSMRWLCEDNPFFQYIAGEKCVTEYPDPARTSDGKSEDTKDIVPLKDRKPSAWIFRNWPKTRYIRSGSPTKEYTPVWQVVGDYLQSTL